MQQTLLLLTYDRQVLPHDGRVVGLVGGGLAAEEAGGEEVDLGQGEAQSAHAGAGPVQLDVLMGEFSKKKLNTLHFQIGGKYVNKPFFSFALGDGFPYTMFFKAGILSGSSFMDTTEPQK